MQRSKLLKLVLFSLTAVVLASCEKVIDVDLKDASPILVIEGFVSNRADSQYVFIRKTVPFTEPSVYPAVSGAVVTITTDNGRVYNLTERRPGYYMARNFTGRSGNTYNLKVQVEGKEYTASSKMPPQVNIDSLGVSVNTYFGEEQRSIQVIHQDPPGVKNYYKFILSINGELSENTFSFDDNFNDGRNVTRDLFDFDLDIESGDRADILMLCIDAPIFRYWQGVEQNQSRGGASTTPANPESNISNGALGYFSAQTVQYESIIIP